MLAAFFSDFTGKIYCPFVWMMPIFYFYFPCHIWNAGILLFFFSSNKFFYYVGSQALTGFLCSFCIWLCWQLFHLSFKFLHFTVLLLVTSPSLLRNCLKKKKKEIEIAFLLHIWFRNSITYLSQPYDIYQTTDNRRRRRRRTFFNKQLNQIYSETSFKCNIR